MRLAPDLPLRCGARVEESVALEPLDDRGEPRAQRRRVGGTHAGGTRAERPLHERLDRGPREDLAGIIQALAARRRGGPRGIEQGRGDQGCGERRGGCKAVAHAH